MYGTTNSEIPGVGKVELAWIQTPLPPVALPPAIPAVKHETEIKHEQATGNGDVNMENEREGDAMAQAEQRASAPGHRQEQLELDYDVGDDNEWVQ